MRGFGRPSTQLTFDRRSDNKSPAGPSDDDSTVAKVTTTVADYFAQKYKPLRYPHLPCVDARKGSEPNAHWLPMEVVKVTSFLYTYFS